jgi:anaphase-promoting complex subunit 5
MIRYLTPSKIGILVLIVLYSDAVVPDDAIIPVLSFITSRLINQPVSESDSSSQPASPTLSISDFEELTKNFKSPLPGRTLYDTFLQYLWGIDSLHALHDFFRDLSETLTKNRAQLLQEGEASKPPKAKIPLSRVSPLGVFVRRSQLEFVRLQFDGSVKLWVAFTKFREASEPYWKKRRPSAGAYTLDSNLADLNLNHESPLVNIVYPNLNDGSQYEPELSTEEMERILDFQLEKLQRKLSDCTPCTTG